MSRQSDRDREFMENLLKHIKNEYGFNDKVTSMIVSRAFDQGHAYGYEEVQLDADSLAYWVDDLLKASKEN